MAGIFEVKIQIDAPVEWVWQVLIDFEHYGEWNPFITRIKGEAKIGSYIYLYVKLDPRVDSLRFTREMIVSLKEKQHLGYDSHFLSSSLFNAVRWQVLKSVDDGSKTIYHSSQKITGFASWPVTRTFGDKIAEGFEASSLALKARAESLYQEFLAKNQH